MNLYISDLDGTLLTPNAILSPYTTKNLNELINNKALNFSIATARTPATVVPLLKDLNLKLPLIVMNGAATYSLEKGEYVKYNPITESSSLKIQTILDSTTLSYFCYTLKDNHIYVYFDKELNRIQREFMDERKGSPLKSFIKDSIPKNSEILYFFLMEKKEVLLPIYDEIIKVPNISAFTYEDIYNKGYYILEIFSENSSKANSIKELMTDYNFSNLTVFGDNFNDIPMFKIADNKIAVSNAVGAIKELSTKIIDSNKNDGVINYLLDLFE